MVLGQECVSRAERETVSITHHVVTRAMVATQWVSLRQYVHLQCVAYRR